MPLTPLIESLIFQYNNLFQVLTATIRPLSRKQWVGGRRPGQIPVRQACHILWSCKMYAGGRKRACQARFGCAVHSLDGEIDPELYPTPKQVIEYAVDVQEAVQQWLGSKTESNLRRSKKRENRYRTELGFILYVLRHATLHLGFLCAELDNRGIRTAVFH